MTTLVVLSIFSNVFAVAGIIVLVILFGGLALYASCFKKAIQGQALVRTGVGGTKVSFDGMLAIPVIHKFEVMDISIKKLEIDRLEKDGLICKDNLRADIKVAFFVRVNKSKEDVVRVAQIIGCGRASDLKTLVALFEAKFSEALKTVGKKFDFVQLYESRQEFREEILKIIGRDLNGYVLDDCAIDYLEQTPVSFLKADNILDAQGIKKITELTAVENIKSNLIRREEEQTINLQDRDAQKIIKKQDVEARETILELEKQLAEKEEKQKREIANIVAREEAEVLKVSEQEKLKAESQRIITEEELKIAEENKDRQIIVARKNKERTEAIETERVEKDRLLEVTERERIVTLAEIEKEKVVEVEKKNIQDVIKERVMLEKGVVEEQENIKDLEAFKEADRNKRVAVTNAERDAEQKLIGHIQEAEAEKEAAKIRAEQVVIEADAQKEASSKESEARMIIADATAKEEATIGLSEAQVIEAKAHAEEAQGVAQANVIEKKAIAEAKGIEAKAEALRKEGMVNAEVTQELAFAEAKGIEEKADAMKKFNDAGKEHEEFKLNLDKEKIIDLAQINIQKDIADAQASVIAEALKAANIDIVGGETMFFESIIGQITKGKGLDQLIDKSDNLTDLKHALLGGANVEGDTVIDKVRNLIKNSGFSSEDVKNLTLSSLILKLHDVVDDSPTKSSLQKLLSTVEAIGIGKSKAGDLGL